MPEQTPPARTEISSLGEFGLIEHLSKNIKTEHPSSLTGIGDDAAVIDNDGFLTLVSTDLLVDEPGFAACTYTDAGVTIACSCRDGRWACEPMIAAQS